MQLVKGARFRTVVRKARFSYNSFTPQQMVSLAQGLTDDVRNRILRAEDIHDQAAPALSPRYEKRKSRKSPPAIRDWRYTGRTLRSMKVLKANQNRATIGFTDSVANIRATLNNRKWRQFGVSPKNQQKLVRSIYQARPVKVVVAA